MCRLIEDSWVFRAAAAFSVFCSVVLVEVYKEENLASQDLKSKEGRSILIAFLGNCGCFSLILYQNLTNGSFLMEFEVRSVNLYNVTLKSISLLYFKWIFYPYMIIISCIGYLENGGSLNYVELPDVTHFIIFPHIM